MTEASAILEFNPHAKILAGDYSLIPGDLQAKVRRITNYHRHHMHVKSCVVGLLHERCKYCGQVSMHSDEYCPILSNFVKAHTQFIGIPSDASHIARRYLFDLLEKRGKLPMSVEVEFTVTAMKAMAENIHEYVDNFNAQTSA